ncbi:MAG: transcriptional repressor [Dehalococcoidia bacterium]|nr:transcriptional repressor [Dehalococcoidia bacterium]
MLNTAGHRMTRQRTLLLDLIKEAGGHLDADELYRRAREKQPRVSLSTVYRALHLFKKMGLVEEYHFDESHHHYEATSKKEHHHLLCLGCGRVIEFQSPLSRYVTRNVPEARDFHIVDTELRMTGYCSNCRKTGQ